jgi:hypothetical protein
MLRLLHCLDNRLADGGKVVSPTHRPRFTPQRHYFSCSASGTLTHVPEFARAIARVRYCCERLQGERLAAGTVTYAGAHKTHSGCCVRITLPSVSASLAFRNNCYDGDTLRAGKLLTIVAAGYGGIFLK